LYLYRYGESVYGKRADNTIPKEKGQKDKQLSKKHTHKTKDRVTGTPLKTGGELRCSGSIRYLYDLCDVYISRKMKRSSQNN
jgi:hypothetical protein